MYKETKVLLTVALFATIVWIYRCSVTSNTNNIILKRYEYLTKDYILQPKDSACAQRPLLVVLVTSYAGHVELRSAHRRAMPAELLRSLNATRVFLLAAPPPTDTSVNQNSIENENEIYGDILQGAFEEHYRNLTHKHLMGLQWAATQCDRASYILKIDDDTVFSLDKTFELLSKLENINKEQLLIGYMLNDTRPRRAKQNKWYVSWEEYGRSKYPLYLSGWYYVTTPVVAAALVEEAMYHPFFWIDDVFVTGILAEVRGITLKSVPKGFWMEYYEQVECCIKYMIQRNIKCDYAVGPNGSRNNLIVEFSTALEECDKRMECKIDASEPSCVVGKNRAIFSDGRGEIEPVKFS